MEVPALDVVSKVRRGDNNFIIALKRTNSAVMATLQRSHESLIIAMKSMNAADITTQHDNLFKVWFCVFPKLIFTLRSSVEIRN